MKVFFIIMAVMVAVFLFLSFVIWLSKAFEKNEIKIYEKEMQEYINSLAHHEVSDFESDEDNLIFMDC